MEKDLVKPEDSVTPQILASSIVRISDSLKAWEKNGIKKETLVLLVASHSGVPKTVVRQVLTSIEQLRKAYTTI